MTKLFKNIMMNQLKI